MTHVSCGFGIFAQAAGTQGASQLPVLWPEASRKSYKACACALPVNKLCIECTRLVEARVAVAIMAEPCHVVSVRTWGGRSSCTSNHDGIRRKGHCICHCWLTTADELQVTLRLVCAGET